jgi:hypothetical protein
MSSGALSGITTLWTAGSLVLLAMACGGKVVFETDGGGGLGGLGTVSGSGGSTSTSTTVGDGGGGAGGDGSGGFGGDGSGGFGECPLDYVEGEFRDQPGVRFCYRLEETASNWAGARDACREEGAELASIHSADEVAFLFQLCMNVDGTNCWVGGNDIAVEGQWRWTDGTTWGDFDFWCCQEPDDAGGQDCMMIWQNWEGGGPGSDDTCSIPHPYFCKTVL